MKPTLAIGHPFLERAGSELKVLWAIQALREQFKITLVTCGGFDLAELNAFCGTSVRQQDFSLHLVSLPSVLRSLAAALRGAIFLRAFRRLAPKFDVLMSAYNPCDLGRRSIQCIADFSWHQGLRRRYAPMPRGLQGVFHRFHLLRRLYLGACGTVCQNSYGNVLSRDLLVANSNWTAAQLRELGAREVVVIYPPLPPPVAVVPWAERLPHFVCLGRIVPQKRVELVIEILDGVRRLGHPIKLTVVGQCGSDKYGRFIQRLARRHQEWVQLKGAAYGAEKARIINHHRFGLHACVGEAFGISIAEMLRADCLVFAPTCGGPAEILNHEALCYANKLEAVQKIDRVLRDPSLQSELRGHLSPRAQFFSAERFVDRLQSTLEGFLRERHLNRRTQLWQAPERRVRARGLQG